MRRKLVVVAAAAASLIAVPGIAQAAGSTYVSAGDLNPDCGASPSGWCTSTAGAGKVGLVDAATGTPAGQHLQLSTPSGSDKAYAYEYNNLGNALSGISKLSYSYLVTDAPTTGEGPNWAPSLNVEIDTNGPNVAGGYAVLVYEPLYVEGFSTPVTRTWTTENPTASAGGWWVTRGLEDGLQTSQARNAWGGATWAEVQAYFPHATVLGIGVNQGSGNGGLTSQVDLITVDETTYDFAASPQAADDCKSSGWASYAERAFPNQGQCIQFVNTGKFGRDNAPAASTSSSGKIRAA